ncbi:MAG: DUF4230 domain-containing protein [Chitinophagaceae bacterium]
MALLQNNFKKFRWIAIPILILLVLIAISATSFKQTAVSSTMTLLIAGLILGAVIMYLLLKQGSMSKQRVVSENSHTVIESIRKVFKIVFAEGHFNELYNYEETKKLFGFIPTTKRALVVIKAKVLIGYDFEKCVWEIDENNKKVKMISFPEPEILSIEPDYLYYNFDEGMFNLLGREDLTQIQINGKKQVELAAIKSHLPKIAADQMRTILLEVVQSRNWQLEDSFRITEGVTKNLLVAGGE